MPVSIFEASNTSFRQIVKALPAQKYNCPCSEIWYCRMIINTVKQPAAKKCLYCSCAAAAWAIPASDAINKAWCSLCDPFKIKHMQNAKAANKDNYTSHNNAKEDIFCPLCMIFIFMIHNHLTLPDESHLQLDSFHTAHQTHFQSTLL